MNTQKKVFEKLFSNEKVEMASQKYEFAKKPSQILSEVKKIDDLLAKASLKMGAADKAYRAEYANFQGILDQVASGADSSEKDLLAIMDAITAIGGDSKSAQGIDGFKPAADLVTRLKDLVPKFRKLYTKIS
jgi:polyphosphate kinase 2 (PPK2 family)